MADQKAPQMQATLGLTGLTSNAMALIAPGAFLWLTFFIQATTGTAGQPSTAPAMWMGIFLALLLCLATAVAYAEISKLYPGTGSSYYYAEQAMLSQKGAFKYARLAKFIVGWGSHLYYWVYPGVMVAVTGVFVGYVVGIPLPEFHQRRKSRPDIHGPGRRCVFILCRLDCLTGSGRFDGSEHRNQRGADLGAAGVQRSCIGLPHRVILRARRAVGFRLRCPNAVHLHLPVRDQSKGRVDHPRCQRRSAASARFGRKAGPLHDHLSRQPMQAATSSRIRRRRRSWRRTK